MLRVADDPARRVIFRFVLLDSMDRRFLDVSAGGGKVGLARAEVRRSPRRETSACLLRDYRGVGEMWMR